MSTDNTKEIALDNGCIVHDFDTEGRHDDINLLNIKMNCYREDTDYDWTIVVDSDEFITHKDGIPSLIKLLEHYKEKDIKVPSVKGYDMFCWDHDFNTPLDNISRATPNERYSKLAIFNPKVDMRWDVGCHESSQEPDSYDDLDIPKIILKHYKYINFEWMSNKNMEYGKRLSERNLQYGLGWHYLNTKQDWMNRFKELDALVTEKPWEN